VSREQVEASRRTRLLRATTERGFASLTLSDILVAPASRRSTFYKYFADS
jgi:hypothetical protein